MNDVLVFEPLHEDTIMPSRATEDSAGYDLHAYLRDQEVTVYSPNNVMEVVSTYHNELVLYPGARALVPTGFKAKLPRGCEAQIRARSGLAVKQGVVPINSPGTIDADFPNEWKVLLTNHSSMPVTIEHCDRIAQAVIARYEVPLFIHGVVKQSTDRSGGMGSTGR